MNISFNYLLLIILIIIDVCKLNILWNERYVRRVLHHFQRLIYNSSKKPEIYLNQKLKSHHIDFLNSIPFEDFVNSNETKSSLLSKLFGGNYSQRGSLFLQDFDKKTQKTLIELGEYYIPQFELLLGKKLYLSNTKDKVYILRYEGKNSNFGWHYDNEPSSYYRALFLFKKVGTLPEFLYKDKSGKVHRLKHKLGDGIFFKGTQTHHAVEKSNDPNTVRYMITLQYTTNPNQIEKSICSEFSAVPFKNIIKKVYPNALLFVFLMFLVLKFGSKYRTNISLKNLITIVALSIVFLLYMPSKLLGTRINATPLLLIKYYIFILTHILLPVESLLYTLYILLTEAILRRNIW